MANSRFEYVKKFERNDELLPNTYIIMRIDGRGFHKLSNRYKFEKPNDLNALHLMNDTARRVMSQISDIIMAYGDSDEYSFLLDRNCQLFDRRESKLISTFASLFTTIYQYLWNEYFPLNPLKIDLLPQFDARSILYPEFKNIKDYFSWRQADCHINNLYNTTFWALVLKDNQSPKDAHDYLKLTISSDKHEILFKKFQINYNNELDIFKKGTVLLRIKDVLSKKKSKPYTIEEFHKDIIGDSFWKEYSSLF